MEVHFSAEHNILLPIGIKTNIQNSISKAKKYLFYLLYAIFFKLYFMIQK
jgi:hypothetical protein